MPRDELIAEALDIAEMLARVAVSHFPSGRRHLYKDVHGQTQLLLVQAAIAFDPAKRVPWRAWAKWFIARRLVDSIRRRKMRDDNHISLEVLPSMFHGEPEQETALEHSRIRKLVQASLGVLSARDADIIIRFYYLGETLQEIADALAIGVTTLSRLKRAAMVTLEQEMRKLKETLPISSLDGSTVCGTPPESRA